MKLWCFVALCSLRVVYGCVGSDRTLDCSSLNLTEVPRPEEVNYVNETVEYFTLFNLSFNALISPINFSDWSVENIKVVDLSHNNLSFVDTKTFDLMKNLKAINLSNNELSRINLDWTLIPTVEYLDLSKNTDLGGLMHIFRGLSKSNITHLNLSSTGAILPSYDVFSKVTSLLSLDLSGNELNFIPDLPANLEFLDFSNNSIMNINPYCFDKDTRLKTMLLEYNRNLNDIMYESFNHLLELRRLSFKGCTKLSHLPSSLFSNNIKLEFLSLARCSFRNISVAFKSSFLAINTIELEGNPWHCSSHIKWFVQLHDHKILSDNIRCATPENISLAEYLGPKVKHKVVRILLTITSVVLFCMLITAVGFSCSMENRRRKTLNSYAPLERTSKPYRGNMIYVTTSV